MIAALTSSKLRIPVLDCVIQRTKVHTKRASRPSFYNATTADRAAKASSVALLPWMAVRCM